MVFVRGVETQDQLDRIWQEISIPIFLSTPNVGLQDLAELSKTNVRIVLRRHRPIKAAYLAVMRAMQADIEGKEFPDILRNDALRRYLHSDEHDSINHRFLGAKSLLDKSNT